MIVYKICLESTWNYEGKINSQVHFNSWENESFGSITDDFAVAIFQVYSVIVGTASQMSQSLSSMSHIHLFDILALFRYVIYKFFA